MSEAEPHPPAHPRALTDAERRTLMAVASVLIPPGGELPGPLDTSDYDEWLERALRARGDAFEQVTALLESLAGLEGEELLGALRSRHQAADGGASALASVVAGAYLLVPEVRSALAYPGQVARPARFDEAAEQIMGGILDPVMKRGPIFREVP